MQVLDEQKRSNILAAAANQFAAGPYHKVCLSEVAAAAAVGKGTLYLYFKDKEDLYLAVLCSGYEELLTRLQGKVVHGNSKCRENLRAVVEESVRFACRNPEIFELLRSGQINFTRSNRLKEVRDEVTTFVASVIRNGIADGSFQDTHPELTAGYIPGLVRSGLMNGGKGLTPAILTEHIYGLLYRALSTKK